MRHGYFVSTSSAYGNLGDEYKGDRPFKLDSGTSSEPGRYVKSLGEPVGGRARLFLGRLTRRLPISLIGCVEAVDQHVGDGTHARDIAHALRADEVVAIAGSE